MLRDSSGFFSLSQAISTHLPFSLQHIFAGLLIALSLVAFSTNALANSEQEKAAKKELAQLQQRINKLKNAVNSTKTKRTKTEKALKSTEVTIGKTSKKLRQVNKDLKAGQAKLKELDKEKTQLHSALNKQQSALGTDIRASYMQGRQEYVKLLLNQEQPEKLARTLRYYDYFHRSRSQRINEFTETLEEIATVTDKINHEKVRLGKLKTKLTEQKDKLLSAQKERKVVIAKLDKELSGSGNKLDKLLSDELELQALLDAVQQTLDDLPPDIGQVKFRTRKGKLPWPVAGKLSHRFGTRKHKSKLKWKGVVIRANDGQDVHAVHHGRVIFSDWMRGIGLLLIVDHGDGYFSLYGHNQTLLKDTGDWVNPGEVIASVGNSGGQAKSGLYFEIREAGKPTNPLNWIAKK